MSKTMDPEIKAIRAVMRALSSLSEESARRRVSEWLYAREHGLPWSPDL